MSIKPPMGDYRACFIDRQRECHFHSPPTARLFFKLYKVPSERKAFNSNCGRVFFEEICLRSVKGDIKTFCKKSSWETANGGGYFCHSRKHTKLNPSGKAVIPFRSDGKKSIRFPFLDNFFDESLAAVNRQNHYCTATRFAVTACALDQVTSEVASGSVHRPSSMTEMEADAFMRWIH